MSLAAFGLGRVWHDMPMWPREVRRDLFSGFQATRRGDNTMGVLNLSRAWETAKSLPVEKFGEYPFLKLSGIAIALAGAYDASGNTELAYEIYQEALSQLQDFTTPGAESSDASSRSLRGDLSTAERVRAVAISAKLGELARKLHKPPMEEEKWLAYSVETVLRDIMGVESVKNEVTAKDRDSDEIAKDVTEAMKLPPLWALRHDLAAPFEALGSFYARNGNPKFAMPLYFQAISLLMPPSPQVTSRRDKCRAAHIMGQISELIIRAGSDGAGVDHQALVEAETWAKTGLGITTEARRSFKEREGICEVAYAFMLYNLALIRELSGDQSKARELFVESLDQSKAIGFREGIKNAEKAIRVVGQEPVTISSLLPY
ncbi:hypothetical protein DFP72DRAFT_415123 [Ephemerocybe angulata]|uniref:Uncharacterized protein n=1 Tax=Ephemerocybe angulata TaxID=980116 RepID=A0A8H6MCH1_9AGAR|nr:hypothetical protein DFP72DRAFT_415123 [Tulosesus angulatus]